VSDAGRIFISYRRGDTAGHAGRLSDGLSARFGPESVFMDLDAIAPGTDFEAKIRDEVSACDVVLVLIGDQWSTVSSQDGRRRIDDPGDYVRQEVAAALARDGLTVVPVLVEGARMPGPAELPDDLKRLARINAIELSDQRWRFDIGRLEDAIARALPRSTRSRSSGRLLRIGLPAALLLVAVAVVLAVTLGSDTKKPAPPGPKLTAGSGAGPPGANQLDALDRTIVPGRSVGPVALGQTPAQVRSEMRFLGAPHRQGNSNEPTFQWQLGDSLDQYLQVSFDASGHVAQIVDTSGLFQLNGVTLLGGLDAVRRALGPNWTKLRCSDFTVLYLDNSRTGPSTVWSFGSKNQLLVQNFVIYPGNAPC
jgi:hypothetical protein